jgi:ribonuclease HI
MELTAVIEGIKAVKERFPTAQITVVTDSQYVVNTMTKCWQKKANQDLWQQLDKVIGDNKPQWQWVKGHNQHPGNERADYLANLGVASLQEQASASIPSPIPPVDSSLSENLSQKRVDPFPNSS